MTTLSERIRVLRGERTYAQFAKVTGLSAQTLHAAEHNKSIRVGTLRTIADACKVEPDAWIPLLILWIRAEVGDEDFSKLDIAPSRDAFQMHVDHPFPVGDLVLSMFSKLPNQDQAQLLKAMARPSVRMCLAAINNQFENQSVPPETWVDNEVIENVTRGLHAGDIIYSKVRTGSGKSTPTAVRKKRRR